ncbi:MULTISPECIES: type II toxin-antitoxin system Phd/YefM family antitoxin [Sphingomonas]|jgi:antitoxin (DNA-binding transcriptional repressor) of toxin-antitoxin stability system|nr:MULTISPECIES: type II toxin-antitoxin system prevent-host-death family antitoxin [Sphingomonas]MBA2918579.1 type II toxin-antitoxin system prevent-host-death family antitoxin [Sphingomonas sp. CGMCC 1.13658]
MAQVEQVGVRDLRAKLSHYLRVVAEGGRVVVMQRGKPIAQLGAPTLDDGVRRTPGTMKGEIWMAEDFDEWPEDILASFEEPLR